MKYGIFIGRFQPPTLSHLTIINQSLKKYDKLIVLVGSSKATPSLRNPFNLDSRIRMIKASFQDNDNLIILPIQDSNYNFNQWIRDVQTTIGEITSKNNDITLIGYFKDAGSYWLNAFPQWKFDSIEKFQFWSGSQIREDLFNYGAQWESKVSSNIKDLIINWRTNNSDLFEYFCSEQSFINNYKKQWNSTPYPPIFITTDSIVFCKGHILIIKRKRNPGKDLYALPGGFLNNNEYIKDCAIRELKEETKINVARPILENSLKKSKVFDDPIRDMRGRTITHVHIFDLNLKEIPEIKADDDAKEVMWLSFNEIDNIQDKFYADHYQIIKNILNEI
jgi:bifunctional NMN adenylyltransferase/nudix hydrolase